MTKFISAFEDFFKSIYELLASVIGTLASLVNTFINTILNFFTGILNLFSDVFKGTVDLVGGIGKFITGTSGCPSSQQGHIRYMCADSVNNTGNIVVIGVIAAAGYLYVRSM